MFYKFKKGKQKELLEKAIEKAKSEVNLSKIAKIPKGSVYALKNEKRNISEANLKKIMTFMNIKEISSRNC